MEARSETSRSLLSAWAGSRKRTSTTAAQAGPSPRVQCLRPKLETNAAGQPCALTLGTSDQRRTTGIILPGRTQTTGRTFSRRPVALMMCRLALGPSPNLVPAQLISCLIGALALARAPRKVNPGSNFGSRRLLQYALSKGSVAPTVGLSILAISS
jgi:hypothetical protein